MINGDNNTSINSITLFTFKVGLEFSGIQIFVIFISEHMVSLGQLYFYWVFIKILFLFRSNIVFSVK